MDEDKDVFGCLGAFIISCLRLFIPVSIIMAIAVTIAYFGETITNTPLCGVGLLVIIPVVLVFLVFSRRGGQE